MNNVAQQIDLSTPIKGEWVGRERFAWTYRCPAGHTIRVNCNPRRGKQPEPGVGAIDCPRCDVASMGDAADALIGGVTRKVVQV